jgi:hypothetical protein
MMDLAAAAAAAAAAATAAGGGGSLGGQSGYGKRSLFPLILFLGPNKSCSEFQYFSNGSLNLCEFTLGSGIVLPIDS